MTLASTCLPVALLMLMSGIAHACESPASVVAIRYLVREQLPERVEASVTNPLERFLVRTPRLTELNSNTGHGTVDFALQFQGGATTDDLAAVKRVVAEVALHERVDVLSSTIELTRTCLNPWPVP